ncbi:LysM peptidoglycan-binding domain-containing protein [Sporolactobacillus sp. THM7-4]|nr:LysM peptidoglycan-binding domain-containing protein [Sporolactobacillus sp. THM7-4]
METVKIYVVQKGDTMEEIARKHGMTIEEFKKMNAGLTESQLVHGMKVKVAIGKKPLKKIEQAVRSEKKAKPPIMQPKKEKSPVPNAVSPETPPANKPIGGAMPNIPKAPVGEAMQNMPKAPVVKVAPNTPKAPVGEAMQNMPKAPVVKVTPNIPKAPIGGVMQNMPKAPVGGVMQSMPKAPVGGVMQNMPQAPVGGVMQNMPQAPVGGVMQNMPQAPVGGVMQNMPQAPVGGAMPNIPKAPVGGVMQNMPQAPVTGAMPNIPKAPVGGVMQNMPQAPVTGAMPNIPQAPVGGVMQNMPKSPVDGAKPAVNPEMKDSGMEGELAAPETDFSHVFYPKESPYPVTGGLPEFSSGPLPSSAPGLMESPDYETPGKQAKPADYVPGHYPFLSQGSIQMDQPYVPESVWGAQTYPGASSTPWIAPEGNTNYPYSDTAGEPYEMPMQYQPETSVPTAPVMPSSIGGYPQPYLKIPQNPCGCGGDQPYPYSPFTQPTVGTYYGGNQPPQPVPYSGMQSASAPLYQPQEPAAHPGGKK